MQSKEVEASVVDIINKLLSLGINHWLYDFKEYRY